MIEDCGELKAGEDDGVAVVDDGTGDVYPDWFEDSDLKSDDVSLWFAFVSFRLFLVLQ